MRRATLSLSLVLASLPALAAVPSGAAAAAPGQRPPAGLKLTALPARTFLPGVKHEYQRFNNCGPVTIGMAMNYWGGTQTQKTIAPALKPNAADKNVSPNELAAYARAQGYGVHQGQAGDFRLLRTALAAGFPVIVETWFVTGSDGGMGHYRLLNGYNDAGRYFSALDSYYGPSVRMGYAELAGLWRGFNKTYLVVYPPERAAQVQVILGRRARPDTRLPDALSVARKGVLARPRSAFDQFNLGAVALALGDARGAARAFDRARAAPLDRALDPTRPARVTGGLPWRLLWYRFEPLEAYLRVGRNADVVALASGVLRDAPDHEEALYWRGRARAALGQLAAARADLRAAVRLRPGYQAARAALEQLNHTDSAQFRSIP